MSIFPMTRLTFSFTCAASVQKAPLSAIVMNMAILGPVLLKALKSQDMYLAGTIVLVQAILVVVGTLLSDIALAWLDPRIRFSERS